VVSPNFSEDNLICSNAQQLLEHSTSNVQQSLEQSTLKCLKIHTDSEFLRIGHEEVIYNQNRQRTVECLLNAGARIDNIRVHPNLVMTPLALTLNIKFGWDYLLDRGAILDEVCLEEVENMIERGNEVALSFVLKVSDKNIDEQIRSK
jgi:hypothetical protein